MRPPGRRWGGKVDACRGSGGICAADELKNVGEEQGGLVGAPAPVTFEGRGSEGDEGGAHGVPAAASVDEGGEFRLEVLWRTRGAGGQGCSRQLGADGAGQLGDREK